MVSIKQVQEVAQRIINESVELSNLVLLQAGYNKLISKLYELENTEKDCPFCEGKGVFSGEYDGIKCHWYDCTGKR